MMMNPKAIFEEAEAAAKAAAEKADAALPPEALRGLDCGFAWVDIKPARGPFVKYLKSIGAGFKKSWGGGGWQIMTISYRPTQSISVHQAAADAFKDVLVKHGINAWTGSRLD